MLKYKKVYRRQESLINIKEIINHVSENPSQREFIKKNIILPESIENIYSYYDDLFMGGKRKTVMTGTALVDALLGNENTTKVIKLYFESSLIVNKKGERTFKNRTNRAVMSMKQRLEEKKITFIQNWSFENGVINNVNNSIFTVQQKSFKVDIYIGLDEIWTEDLNIDNIFYSGKEVKIEKKAENGLKNRRIEVINWLKPIETVIKINEIKKILNFEIDNGRYQNLLRYTKRYLETEENSIEESIRIKVQNILKENLKESSGEDEETLFDKINFVFGGDISDIEEYLNRALEEKKIQSETFIIEYKKYSTTEKEKEMYNKFVNKVDILEKMFEMEKIYDEEKNDNKDIPKYRKERLEIMIPEIFTKLGHTIKEECKNAIFFELEMNNFLIKREDKIKYFKYIGVSNEEIYKKNIIKMNNTKMITEITTFMLLKMLKRGLTKENAKKIILNELMRNARLKLENDKPKAFGRSYTFTNEEDTREKIKKLLELKGL